MEPGDRVADHRLLLGLGQWAALLGGLHVEGVVDGFLVGVGLARRGGIQVGQTPGHGLLDLGTARPAHRRLLQGWVVDGVVGLHRLLHGDVDGGIGHVLLLPILSVHQVPDPLSRPGTLLVGNAGQRSIQLGKHLLGVPGGSVAAIPAGEPLLELLRVLALGGEVGRLGGNRVGPLQLPGRRQAGVLGAVHQGIERGLLCRAVIKAHHRIGNVVVELRPLHLLAVLILLPLDVADLVVGNDEIGAQDHGSTWPKSILVGGTNRNAAEPGGEVAFASLEEHLRSASDRCFGNLACLAGQARHANLLVHGPGPGLNDLAL